MGAMHTPGPWALDDMPEYVDGTDMEVLDGGNFPIASVEASPIINRWHERFPDFGHWADGASEGLTQIHRSQDELLANARLIAAAPDLLAEYKRAVEHIRAWMELHPMDAVPETYAILNIAGTLIAKATASLDTGGGE